MMQFQQMENSQHLRETNFSKVTWLDSKRGRVTSRSASALGVYGTASRGALLRAGVGAHEALPWLSALRRYEGLSIPSLSPRDFFHPVQKISSEWPVSAPHFLITK